MPYGGGVRSAKDYLGAKRLVSSWTTRARCLHLRSWTRNLVDEDFTRGFAQVLQEIDIGGREYTEAFLTRLSEAVWEEVPERDHPEMNRQVSLPISGANGKRRCQQVTSPNPHPALLRSIKLSLRTRELDCYDYANSTNPPVLHRKETFLPAGHPLHTRFAKLTQQEEKHGLLDDTATIGTTEGWKRRLKERGFALRGHRLVKNHGKEQQAKE
jgi:hypothetical protein